MRETLDPRTIRFRQEYQDKHFFTKDGKEEFVITDARTYGDVDITFINSGLKKNTKVGNIKVGLTNPFTNAGVYGKPGPVAFDSYEQQYQNCIYPTNSGDYIKILKYICYDTVEYQFLDEIGYKGVTTIQNIKKGQVRNPFRRSAYGGYLGVGQYNNDNYKWLHTIWYTMITRVTGQRRKYKEQSNSYCNVKSYENLAFDPEWFCYNTFAEWYMGIFNYINTKDYLYNIDKDLLYPYYSQFTGGRKCYSKYTCIIMPKSLNVEIANYGSAKNTKPLLRKTIDDMALSMLNNRAIDQDTYCIIKRFIVEDPQYKDYVTTRFQGMRHIINFANFYPAEMYQQLGPYGPPNIPII